MNIKIKDIYDAFHANKINFERVKADLHKLFAIEFLHKEFETLFEEKPDGASQAIPRLTIILNWLGLQHEFLSVYNRLLTQTWHTCHDLIIGEIINMKSPESVQYIEKAIKLKFNYFSLDESDTEYVKFIHRCMWALADINTPKAIELLHQFKKDQNEVISRGADEQLRWLKGEKGMRYMP